MSELFAGYLLSPYGMNQYSLAMLIIAFLSFYESSISAYNNMERINIPQLVQAVFTGNKLQFSSLMRLSISAISESSREAIHQLCMTIQLCLPDLFKIRKAILFDQNIVFQSIQKLTLIPLILEMVMTAPKKFGLAALCACIAVVAVFTAICFGIAAKRTSQLFNANLHRVEISVCLHSFPVHLL